MTEYSTQYNDTDRRKWHSLHTNDVRVVFRRTLGRLTSVSDKQIAESVNINKERTADTRTESVWASWETAEVWSRKLSFCHGF